MRRERRPARRRSRFPLAILVVIAVASLLAARGPDWLEHFNHPLGYQQTIAENAAANGLDPYLVAAVINVESRFDPDRVSPRGAVGLMQVLPATAAEVAQKTRLHESVTSESLKRPGTNIRVGTSYLKTLVGQVGDVEGALAAYNAGATNAGRWQGLGRRHGRPFRDVVDFPETRRYIDEVLVQRDRYAELYPGAFEETAAK